MALDKINQYFGQLSLLAKFSIISLLAVVAVATFAGTQKTYAATYTYPDCCEPDSFASASRGSNTGLNGIYLNAPTSYMEAKFSPDADYFLFTLWDIGWHDNNNGSRVDAGSSIPNICAAGDVTIRIYGSNSSGNIASTPTYTGDAATLSGCETAHQILFYDSTAPPTLSPYPTPTPVASDGYKHLFVRIDFNDVGGGSNMFKVTAQGFTDPPLTIGNSVTRLGFSDSGLVMSLVHAPLSSTGFANYQLNFKVPCTRTDLSFNIEWFDADRGGIPNDTDIDWFIINDTTGQVYTRTQALGGQGVPGFETINNSSGFRVRAGDKYTWHWWNVDNNNGVQMKLPFTEVDYDDDCTWNYDPRIYPVTPAAGSIVAPGSTIIVGARAYNNGPDQGLPFNMRLRPVNASTGSVSLVCGSWSNPGIYSWGTSDSANCPGTPAGTPLNATDAMRWGKYGSLGGGGIAAIPPLLYSPVITSPPRQVSYQVSASAVIGSQICFVSGITHQNQTDASASAWEESSQLCFTVGTPVQWQLEEEQATIKGVEGSTGSCATGGANELISFGSVITNTGSAAVTTTGNANLADIRINDLIPSTVSGTTLTRQAGVVVSRDNVAIGSGATANYTMPVNNYRIPTTAQLGDVYTVTIDYLDLDTGGSTANPEAASNFYGLSGGAVQSSGPRKASACIRITDYAYMKVLGSGVHNGAVWRTLETCQGDASQFITNTTLPIEGNTVVGNIGSSAEYGVTSLTSPVTSFASGIIQDRVLGFIRFIQTFANNNVAPLPPYGHFLGGASSPAKCLTDFYEELDDPSLVPQSWSTIESAADNLYDGGGDVSSAAYLAKLSGNILPGEIDHDGKAVVLVDGDLNITDDITYDQSEYGTAAQLTIPSLVVIVKGNINISSNVEQLDGLYIAIPDGPDTGKINTCGAATTINLPATCRSSKLTVNGGFIANDIDFYRFINGRLAALAAVPASQDGFASEVFDFSPELYMSNPFAGLLDTSNLNTQDYDYYTERAPVY